MLKPLDMPLRDRALAALQEGRPLDARSLLQAIGPDLADDPLGLQLLALSMDGDVERADGRALLERAVRIAPGDPQAHFNLAVVLQAQDCFDQAILHYRHSLRLEPTHLGALNNLSDLLRRRNQAQEGWEILRRYQDAGGDVAGLELRYAKMAMDTRRFAEAGRWFDLAEARQPGSALVGWEHAMLTLAREEFAQGWPQYERRLETYGGKALGIKTYPIPRWNGEALAKKRILLHREQGLGDMIMFSSLFDDVIAQAKQVHIAIHPPLARLMAFNFPKAKVWSSVTSVAPSVDAPATWLKAAGPIDMQIPIASLGLHFRSAGFAAPKAYLKAAPQDVADWRERLQQLAPLASGTLRIGLVSGARQVEWSDDARTNGMRKSVPPAELAVLAEIKGVQWISLHDRAMVEAPAQTPGLDIIDCSPWIDDLADTAALIETLDAVVCVDTAVAHLAAAMGKPVHLLLWWNADWRWGLERQDSYWYPNVKPYAQQRSGDWGPVLKQIVTHFSALSRRALSSPVAQNGRQRTKQAA